MTTNLLRVLIARFATPTLAIEEGILSKVGVDIVDGRSASDEEIAKLCQHVDGIIGDYFIARRSLIERMERCRVICQYGVGLDHIDLEAATERGIVVTHTPGYATDEVADHALALLLCIWRKIVFLNDSVRRGQWDCTLAAPMFRIRGSTLGLLGFGNIARSLAVKALAIGFRVIACDPLVSNETSRKLGVELWDLDALLPACDALSIHVPLTAATHHLVGKREIDLMKPTAVLINTSRGGVIDQEALARALRDKRLSGAGLDVMDPEPPNPHSLLLNLPNVVITPHTGYVSKEALADMRSQAAEAVAAVLTGGLPAHVANPKVIDRLFLK